MVPEQRLRLAKALARLCAGPINNLERAQRCFHVLVPPQGFGHRREHRVHEGRRLAEREPALQCRPTSVSCAARARPMAFSRLCSFSGIWLSASAVANRRRQSRRPSQPSDIPRDPPSRSKSPRNRASSALAVPPPRMPLSAGRSGAPQTQTSTVMGIGDRPCSCR
jgi:hypothetical protein